MQNILKQLERPTQPGGRWKAAVPNQVRKEGLAFPTMKKVLLVLLVL